MTEPQNDTGNYWYLNLQWTDEVGLEETEYVFLQQGGYGPPLAYASNFNLAYNQPPGVVVVQAASQSSNGGTYSLYFVVERLI